MAARRNNLVFKQIIKSNPTALISVKVSVPAYLLSDAKQYGDLTKVVKNALDMAQRNKFVNYLVSDIVLLKSRIEDLNIIKEIEYSEIDQDHLQLLEVYKDCYFKLKDVKLLRKRRAK